jgi:hypothetical protein
VQPHMIGRSPVPEETLLDTAHDAKNNTGARS